MQNKNALNRTMRFESLEDRSMLSVSAFVSSNELLIIGTSANESVQVYQHGTTWKVQGIGGTKVNNSRAAQSFPGIDNIVADLSRGNDFLKIFNGTLLGTLQIGYVSSDTGFKTTQLINLKLASFEIFDAHGGNSILASNIQTTQFEGAIFDVGNGNNVITIANLKLADADLEVLAGSGNNVISIANVQITGANKELIETGDGNDVISISQFCATEDLDIASGGGTDAVVLNRVNISDNVLAVDVGSGKYDALTIIDSTAKAAELSDTGGTNGILTGVKNDFDEITIDPNFTHVSGIENTPC